MARIPSSRARARDPLRRRGRLLDRGVRVLAAEALRDGDGEVRLGEPGRREPLVAALVEDEAREDDAGRGSSAATTSSAPAICGTRSALTKLTASTRGRPAAASLLQSSARTAGASVCGWLWRPSRGPTSQIVTTELGVAELVQERAGLALDVRDLLGAEIAAGSARPSRSWARPRAPRPRAPARSSRCSASRAATAAGRRPAPRSGPRASSLRRRARRGDVAPPRPGRARRVARARRTPRRGPARPRSGRALRRRARRRRARRGPVLSQPRSSSEQTTSRPSRTAWTTARPRIRAQRGGSDEARLRCLLDRAQAADEPESAGPARASAAARRRRPPPGGRRAVASRP